MSSSIVAAAWHASMTHVLVSEGLCIARGQPVSVLRGHARSDVAEILEQAHALSLAGLYVVGGLSYEAAAALDSSLTVFADSDFPLLEFHAFEVDQVSVWPRCQIQAIASDSVFSPWLDSQSGDQYKSNFDEVRRAIQAGEFYQINLTTRLKARRSSQDSWALFQHLYLAQSAPHSVFLRASGFDLISLSPELFFRWDGSNLKTSPMKGTRPPKAAGFDLLSDSDKDRAENVMIVDLLRNDMSKVCRSRSVQVKSLFDVVCLPTVEQMTSSIVGKTREGVRLVDVFSALFPCGSVTGAPKAQAMLRIAQLEDSPRKFYCGALGVLSPGGAAHFNVPIRTVIAQRDTLEYGVGSGMTWYSTCQNEKREWWQKTAFLRQATCDFQVLETLRLEQGLWVNLMDHLARMQATANYFSFVFDLSAVLSILTPLAVNHMQGLFRVRCLLSADGEFTAQLYPLEKENAPVQLRLANAPMIAPPEFIVHKTTFRPEYSHFQSQAKSAFDVLLFNQSGYLTETCRFNLVLKIQGELLTPQICHDTGVYLLPGVLRTQLLRENKIRQAQLTVQDLQRAEQIWLINSLRGWLPVSDIIGVTCAEKA